MQTETRIAQKRESGLGYRKRREGLAGDVAQLRRAHTEASSARAARQAEATQRTSALVAAQARAEIDVSIQH